MKAMSWLVAVIVVAWTAANAPAQSTFAERAKVTVDVIPPKAVRGALVTWKMTMELTLGYHTYPTFQPDKLAESFVTSFRKPKFGPFVFVGDVESPKSHPGEFNTDIGARVEEIDGTAHWQWQFIVHPKAKPGTYKLKVSGTLPACDNKGCTNGDPPEVDFTILEGTPEEVKKEFREEVDNFPLEKPLPGANGNGPPRSTPKSAQPPDQESGVVTPAASLEEHAANLELVRQLLPKPEKRTEVVETGLWAFLGAAVFWGAVALITPCVFPMIPITVSFFLKQSESEHHRPIRMATIYCGTIVVVLGIAALTLLTTFRALSVHWATNIVLGGLFVFFALSLFGMYEIVLPSSWVAFTSQREGRGGIVGTIFMALTFTIVSFTCVAPFLGGFGGMVDSGIPKWQLVLGAFAFSTTFASPFFVLALFPSLIKKLPQSGSWLNSVKVVMGFLELAAALKFLRTAELRLLPMPQYFTYDLVLGIWIAMAFICGLYLLNFFRLHHDEPIEHIGVMRMLLGLVFLALGAYLAPAMFKQGKGEGQRPGGVVYAWVDSFLLPEPSQEDLPWSVNLKGTIDAARQELEKSGKRQFIFLDNTGITCTNCKYNERSIFSRGEIHKLLLGYRLVQHYTDEVPASFYEQKVDKDRRVEEAHDLNLSFQKQMFGTEQLPLYVAMEVTKDKVLVRGVYSEGKINDVSAFAEFLRNSRK